MRILSEHLDGLSETNLFEKFEASNGLSSSSSLDTGRHLVKSAYLISGPDELVGRSLTSM